ncbi:hypothetical protein E2C01_092359 [Portunus trituberculatus]|uniref:Uncharacterized protein n=1 Tax=Portunus trituberculatus TaxID=210409 RepID=A0A5B7JQD1_PORTR|nr:hypothetical protein [Portunus trituberculatus]
MKIHSECGKLLKLCLLPYFTNFHLLFSGASQKGNPSPVTSTEAGERVSRCQIPGLESIEQYRAYLHHREITCTDMVSVAPYVFSMSLKGCALFLFQSCAWWCSTMC